jgi:NAD(P)-dependent dehydrogenase (short-subunit alcohol dehydrogenase family)
MRCECRAQLEETQHSRISLIILGGIQRRHPVENFPDEDWDEVLQVNLNTVFAITRDAGES